MQLTIEVLPAPLGPMIENSSPSFTLKLTSVSARTPPKRSETPRTSKACSTHPLRCRISRLFSRNMREIYPLAFCTLSVFGSWPVHDPSLARPDPAPYSTMGGRFPSVPLRQKAFLHIL